MSVAACRFLRPALGKAIAPARNPAYARFYAAVSGDYEKRVSQLQTHAGLDTCYPRLEPPTDPAIDTAPRRSVQRLKTRTAKLAKNETDQSIGLIVRGSKLVFIDVKRARDTVQIVCNFGILAQRGLPKESFDALRHTLRRGDWISVEGNPHRTSTGAASLLASSLPILLAPSLHQIPDKVDDQETLARRPHLDMLVNPEARQTITMRHHLEGAIESFLMTSDFTRVRTPLLTRGAGGAVARPFETVATELDSTKLNLRISPELWLKRLVVGGVGRVYEMGPAFRNEGVDASHNPEFTICEAYAPLEDLQFIMRMSETLLVHLQTAISRLGRKPFSALKDTIVKFPDELEDDEELQLTSLDSTASMLPEHDSADSCPVKPEAEQFFQPPFRRLRFVPTLEEHMKHKLPNLNDENAHQALLELFAALALEPPARATVPRLLDALCAKYIEPLCDTPTFITEHPAALSPLAKSFTCPDTGHVVAARAELFIRGQEYANMYEEENSPFAQRQKFREQLQYRAVDGEGDGQTEIDESYLECLEWGLPPTAGWGLGVDRLVMLFTGQKRIGDVLPFGTLRNVVGLAARQK